MSYIGVKFHPDTLSLLDKYIIKNNIPNPIPKKFLRATLLCSDPELDNFKTGQLELDYFGIPKRLYKVETGDGTISLVLEFISVQLSERHEELVKKYSVFHKFGEYNPHITLSYDIGDLELDLLSDIKVDIPYIRMDMEYYDKLDINWKRKFYREDSKENLLKLLEEKGKML